MIGSAILNICFAKHFNGQNNFGFINEIRRLLIFRFFKNKYYFLGPALSFTVPLIEYLFFQIWFQVDLQLGFFCDVNFQCK